MGCYASKSRKVDERVGICRERRRIIKQLLLLRSDFAAAQMCYLHSLKNTGATLRQFTDSNSLDLDILLPLHLDLPSPPPPLPAFSDDEDDPPLPPPPLPPDWDDNPPNSSQPHQHQSDEEEPDPNSHYQLRHDDHIVLHPIVISKAEASLGGATLDDELLTTNLGGLNKHSLSLSPPTNTNNNNTKKKTLSGIIKEIDDYFLRASASPSARDVVLLLDLTKAADGTTAITTTGRSSSSKSSKVFTAALSWNWSSKSLHSPLSTHTNQDSYQPVTEPCKPGAHGVTFQRIHVQEDKLYREVKMQLLQRTRLELLQSIPFS